MKYKSNAFEFFKKFKVFVEKQRCVDIEVLCRDREGKFLSNDFNLFCEEHGIHRELIALYILE